MLDANELPAELRKEIEEGNKPSQEQLERLKSLAREMVKNEEIVFEQRVVGVLKKHGLLLEPTKKVGSDKAIDFLKGRKG